ncbi:MAG: hypothetical protein H0W02_19675 [Ktedonobacteraceae bacterium]|nr:hypothetical protein [Ktedonobacteraceae bacterium]
MPNIDDDPVIRVSLFGPVRIVGPSGEVPKEAWGHRPRAKTLLMALLSRQHRRCSRDTLVELVCPDPSAESVGQYLDTLVLHLRRALAVSDRPSLLTTYKGYLGGPVFYDLPDQRTLWCDIDAFLEHADEAIRLAQRGGDPLPALQAAFALSSGGEFLESEIYSDWCREWRMQITTRHEEVALQLARLSIERGLLEQAESALSCLDSDVDGVMTLREAIADLRQQARAQQPVLRLALPVDAPPSPLALPRGLPLEYSYHTLVGHIMTQAMLRSRHIQDVCSGVQRALDAGLRSIDRMTTQPSDYRIPRRQALLTLALLPLSLTALIEQEHVAPAAEEILPQCAASLTACWHLVNGSELHAVEATLPRYLPHLVQLARAASPHQKTAAALASQGYQIASILALHRNEHEARESYAKRSVYFGRLSGDADHLSGAVRQFMGTAYWSKQPQKVLRSFQEAESFLDDASPLLRSGIYVILAWAYAQTHQEQEALTALGIARDAFPDAPEDEDDFTKASFGKGWLNLWQGRTYLGLEQPDNAWRSFVAVGGVRPETTTPERIRLEIVNHQALTAIALDDLDLTRACIESGVAGAQVLGSVKRYNEAFDAYRQARAAWPGEKKVGELADLFVH